MMPTRPPKILYFRDNIHRPGFGATEQWVCPEGTVIIDKGVLVPCDNGQETLIPWSNIKNILWEAPPSPAVLPLKPNARKTSK